MSEQPEKAIVQVDQAPRVPIPIGAGGVRLESFEAAWRLAKCMAQTPFCPRGLESVESLTMGMLYCMSIGLDPITGIQNVAVINGRPSLWGDSMLGLILARPEFEDIVESFENDTAYCMVKRKGRTAVVREFSYADAKQAGLLGKQGPWSQYPRRMAQMRARSWALRDAFADVLRGISMVEEAEDSPEVRATTVVRQIASGPDISDAPSNRASKLKDAMKKPEPARSGQDAGQSNPVTEAHRDAPDEKPVGDAGTDTPGQSSSVAPTTAAQSDTAPSAEASKPAAERMSGRPGPVKSEEDPSAAAAKFAAETTSVSKGRDWLLKVEAKHRSAAMKHFGVSSLADVTDLDQMKGIVKMARLSQLGGKIE